MALNLMLLGVSATLMVIAAVVALATLQGVHKSAAVLIVISCTLAILSAIADVLS